MRTFKPLKFALWLAVAGISVGVSLSSGWLILIGLVLPPVLLLGWLLASIFRD